MSKIFLYGLSILGLFSNVYAGADGLYTNDNSPNTVALSRSNNVGNMENPFVKKNEENNNSGVTDDGDGAAPLINGITPIDTTEISTTNKSPELSTQNNDNETPDGKYIIPSVSTSNVLQTIENPYKTKKEQLQPNTDNFINNMNNYTIDRNNNFSIVSDNENTKKTIINNNPSKNNNNKSIENKIIEIHNFLKEHARTMQNNQEKLNKKINTIAKQIEDAGIIAVKYNDGKTLIYNRTDVFEVNSDCKNIEHSLLQKTNIICRM